MFTVQRNLSRQIDVAIQEAERISMYTKPVHQVSETFSHQGGTTLFCGPKKGRIDSQEGISHPC